jgi:hypothetical protein
MSVNYISVATPPPGVNNATLWVLIFVLHMVFYIAFGFSYNPTVSTTFKPSNDVTSVQTLSDRAFAGRFAGETCSIQSSTSARTWGYNASSTWLHIFLTPLLNQYVSVVLTNNSVTNDLYPYGSTGILGYGVNLPPGSPTNASLIGTFLPYVIVEAHAPVSYQR